MAWRGERFGLRVADAPIMIGGKAADMVLRG
jgi:hypothetical protein